MKVILPTLLIIVSIIMFFFVVDPLYGDIKALRDDVSTYNIAFDNSTSLQKLQDSLLEKYRGIKSGDKEKLSRLLPNTVNNIKFVLEIEQLANIHGMSLKNIKFEDTEGITSGNNVDQKSLEGNLVISDSSSDLKSYGTFPIEFVTEGTYDKFLSFLKDLEYNLRIMDVKSISFTIPTQTSKDATYDPNVYKYIVKVETYWLK